MNCKDEASFVRCLAQNLASVSILSKKIKNFVYYFVLLSTCTNFANQN